MTKTDNTGANAAKTSGLKKSITPVHSQKKAKGLVLLLLLTFMGQGAFAQWTWRNARDHRNDFPSSWNGDVNDMHPYKLWEMRGYVGIGTDAPKAKLHIKGFNDPGEWDKPYQDQRDPVLFLEPAVWEPGRSAKIMFGDTYNYIKGQWGRPMELNDYEGFDFLGGRVGFLGGNVGIGTASPAATLDVARGTGDWGTAAFRGSQQVSHFNFSTTEDTYIRGGKTTSNVYINDAGGNVGIGTTSPSEKLHVKGNIFAEGKYVVQNGVNGGTSRGIFMWTADDNYWGIYMGESGAGRALNGGTAVAGAGFVNHAIRFRAYARINHGFIWENSDNKLLMSLRANDGLLAVEGKIGAREVEVKTGSWADFVFEKNYNLKSLGEIENYIAVHKHLPDVPSEAEIVKNGVAIGEMLKLQMQKIEELTLYLIKQNKQIDGLKKEIETLKK